MTGSIQIGLHAVVVAVDEVGPVVLVQPVEQTDAFEALPFGPFEPDADRTMERGLRRWVTQQTALDLGYVEQLYTFGDHGRLNPQGQHMVSVGYLTLVRQALDDDGLRWRRWYDHLPWEDWRTGVPAILHRRIIPAITAWLARDNIATDVVARVRHAFALTSDGELDESLWDEERVLERYETLYEAGLVEEAVVDGSRQELTVEHGLGIAMAQDHRRILATAMARLRGKLKYRPVAFELLPDAFTLTELQQVVEALSGRTLHKQNFRRIVEHAGLVESTGARTQSTGGRPAALYRYQRAILRERPAPGLRIGG
jgi:hypothetical protein